MLTNLIQIVLISKTQLRIHSKLMFIRHINHFSIGRTKRNNILIFSLYVGTYIYGVLYEKCFISLDFNMINDNHKTLYES